MEIDLPRGDVLVLAGDLFANSVGDPDADAAFQRGHLLRLDEHVARLGYERVVAIAGNHDWVFERIPDVARELRAITYLRDGGVTIGGLRFWGSPWTPEFFSWAFMLPQRSDELAEVWAQIPQGTDVLVTHGPPFGILDRPYGRGRNAGCPLLLERVLEVKPRVHIFGHIHAGHGVESRGPTRFANVALCNETYDPVQPPIVIDLD
jgi:Icc-related predicted phosphoesterase